MSDFSYGKIDVAEKIRSVMEAAADEVIDRGIPEVATELSRKMRNRKTGHTSQISQGKGLREIPLDIFPRRPQRRGSHRTDPMQTADGVACPILEKVGRNHRIGLLRGNLLMQAPKER